MGREPPLLLPRAPARTGATNMGREGAGWRGNRVGCKVYPSPIFRWGRALAPAGARAAASPLFDGGLEQESVGGVLSRCPMA